MNALSNERDAPGFFNNIMSGLACYLRFYWIFLIVMPVD